MAAMNDLLARARRQRDRAEAERDHYKQRVKELEQLTSIPLMEKAEREKAAAEQRLEAVREWAETYAFEIHATAHRKLLSLLEQTDE